MYISCFRVWKKVLKKQKYVLSNNFLKSMCLVELLYMYITVHIIFTTAVPTKRCGWKEGQVCQYQSCAANYVPSLGQCGQNFLCCEKKGRFTNYLLKYKRKQWMCVNLHFMLRIF